jgi:RNA polymerase sigma-70 factor (ECF subfamily)
VLSARLLRMTTPPPVSWEAVETRLRPFVERRVSAPDVEDVMQDVFLRMHKGLASLRDEERFTSWLFQIARSSIAEHARTRVRHPLPTDVESEPPAAPSDDDDRDAARALAGCVSLFVAQLPSPYREAVTLVELEGLPTREAATIVGISVSGMKSRVQRGREQLRGMFDRCCEIALDARGKPTDYSPRQKPCVSCK